MVEDTALSHLRSLLDVQVQLAQQQGEREKRARGKLTAALESLEPGAVEQLNRSGQVIENLGIEALVDLFLQTWQVEVQRVRRSPQSDKPGHESTPTNRMSPGMQALADEALRLSAELDTAREQNHSIQQALNKSRSENQSLHDQLLLSQRTIAAVVENPPPDENGYETVEMQPPQVDEPEWMVQWRSGRGFTREAMFISTLGKTGLGRAPAVYKEAARRASVKGIPNSIRDIARRLEDAGLVEIDQSWAQGGRSSGGRMPDIIRLTERGKEAYRFLTGLDALPCELDLLRQKHQSYEHAHLIMETADFLEYEKFHVTFSVPTAAGLSTSGTFKPDLVAIDPESKVYYIEVERDTHKSSERLPKWRNFHAANGGILYVICDNRTCMRAIRNEITDGLLRHTPGDLYITNLADLRAGKRGYNDGIWLERRLRQNSGANPTL